MTQAEDAIAKVNVEDVLPPPAPTGFDDSHESGGRKSRKGSKKKRLYCFHCNRQENHSNPFIGAWFYSYLIGLSFGLLHFFGPFRCTCCGRNRLMFKDWTHPKFHAIMARNRAASPSSSRRR